MICFYGEKQANAKINPVAILWDVEFSLSMLLQVNHSIVNKNHRCIHHQWVLDLPLIEIRSFQEKQLNPLVEKLLMRMVDILAGFS